MRAVLWATGVGRTTRGLRACTPVERGSLEGVLSWILAKGRLARFLDIYSFRRRVFSVGMWSRCLVWGTDIPN